MKTLQVLLLFLPEIFLPCISVCWDDICFFVCIASLIRFFFATQYQYCVGSALAIVSLGTHPSNLCGLKSMPFTIKLPGSIM